MSAGSPLSVTIPRGLLALFFVAAGVNHFRVPDVYLSIMPPYLPWPEALNYISGAAEILGGVGVLLPNMRRKAGIGLIALLIAVFPANLHMLLNDVPLGGVHLSHWVLWARLPFQGVFIFWVWWVCLRKNSKEAAA